MKSAILTSVICLFALYSHSQTVDLAKDPNKPVLTQQKSNAQLLRESRPAANVSDADTNLAEKYKLPAATSTDTKNSSMFTNEDGQRNHTQQQQINLGNGGTKATNTIHYDNAGRVQGSGTSIQFGNKKK